MAKVYSTGDVNISVSGDHLNIYTVHSETASFHVAKESGQLNVINLFVKNRLTATADNINLPGVRHTGTENKLCLNISGNNGGVADKVNVNVNSQLGQIYEKLNTKNIDLVSNNGNMDLTNFKVDGLAVIKMPDYSIVIYDGTPEVFPDADIQLKGGQPVNLLIKAGRKIVYTDAMIIDYKPQYIINKFSTENSLSRLGGKRSAYQMTSEKELLSDGLYQSLWGMNNAFNKHFSDISGETVIYEPDHLIKISGQ